VSPRLRWRIIGIIALAIVLRPPISGVGPLLPVISDDLSLGTLGESFLTAIPIVCFGLGAFVAPRFVRKVGLDVGMLVLGLLLIIGIQTRSAGNVSLLMVGSLLIGIAIAFANTLLPTVVKRDFSHRIGFMTGLYTTVMVSFAAIGATIAVPLAGSDGTAWRTSFMWWLIPAVVAVVLWLPQIRGHLARRAEDHSEHVTVWRQRSAWLLAFFFGLQSTAFYAMLAWLPTLLQDAGFAPTEAGALLGFSSLVGIPMGLILAPVIAKSHLLPTATTISGVVAIVGTIGLTLSPASGTILWLSLLGIGQGAAFVLALNFITLHSAEPRVTTALSAMVQGMGYLFAGIGSSAMGAIHGATGGWTLPMVLLCIMAIVQTAMGWLVARPQLIHADTVRP
jgi:CP family cyanate transporter-like MFS transporter